MTLSETAVRKSKKDKKTKTNVSLPNTDSGIVDAADEQVSNPTEPSKKRKRDVVPQDEIEIDITLPEPPSKKALRKAKRGKSLPVPSTTSPTQDQPSLEENGTTAPKDDPKTARRSDYGVWIGNLPWSATKATLRTFLTDHSSINDGQITRVHMPEPSNAADSKQITKPQNKGFAYVDFTDSEALDAAIALSETLMGGRRLLIKNAKSFEGRPEKSKETEDEKNSASTGGRKPPNKRVFVGNLGFDVTKEDLIEHYTQCGEVTDLHMATFEDTGKCKGYAWVTFAELDAAKAAVVGWTYKSMGEDEESEDENDNDEDNKDGEITNGNASTKSKKRTKKRKWFVNKLKGRALRCEFAEDATSRYKKRFGKEATARPQDGGVGLSGDVGMKDVGEIARPSRSAHAKWEEKQTTNIRDKRYRKVDARTIKPGAALANAPRASGAIVEAKGKKITFE
ncbi:hypothetical protein AOQ84DRAFT_158179 [Glonium stellatum]|uniref:RRM domain-containing protein n=1 Tax=Glonium stellatum TaxID=574774 RepID=A0A8E2FDK4_9PEZI|nr:hypothetical protein AOQ84DRAFT_158179 [Glonium stellatum]